MTGIYIITNEINNKVYIGKAKNINARLNVHYNKLINNKHLNNRKKPNHLQNAWNQDKEENFTFDILEECEFEELNNKEKYWINYYQSDNPQCGYNKTKGGDGGIPNDEVRRKLSEISKGRISSFKGKKQSDKAKEIASKTHKNKKISEESKNKMSESKKGINNPFFGKQHDIETKIKISNSLTGRKRSEETKQKIKDSWVKRKNII